MYLTTLCTTLLNFFKSRVFSLATSKSSTLAFKSSKIVETLVSLAVSKLSVSAFKAIKYFLAAKSDGSTPVAWSNSLFVG